jgi:uncharacterized membrane protein YwaF
MAMMPFSWPWVVFLLVLVAIAFAIYTVAKRFDLEGRRRILLGLAIANAVLFTAYTISLPSNPRYDFELVPNLPLQFCSLVTVGGIVAVALKSRVIRSLCYFPGAVGGFMALFSPAPVFTGQPVFSLFSIGFFGTHGMNVVLAVMLGALGLFKPSYREAFKGLGYFVALCCSMILVDLVMRWTVYSQTNYFYFFDPEGAGVLEALYKAIPVPIVYELPVVPFALAVFLLQAAMYRGGSKLARAIAHALGRVSEPGLPLPTLGEVQAEVQAEAGAEVRAQVGPALDLDPSASELAGPAPVG